MHFIRTNSFHSFHNFRTHPDFPNLCKEYIYFNQTLARATIPMMEEVIKSAEKLPDDPVCAPLIQYMEQHIAEETDHDEWYVDDLAHLGLSRAEVFNRIPSPNTASLVGSVYYWVKHHHPIAFLGYMGSIETYPSTEAFVKDMNNDSGLPEKAFDTILMHARIDIEHSKDIRKLIDNLPLTEFHFNIIETTAFQTFRYMSLVMNDICKLGPIKN